MVILFHGEAGGWDELIIAAIAFAVLWVAVKLAGRKAADEDESDGDADAGESKPVDEGAARPPATPLG
jgi:hypothetical protein